MNKKLKNLTIRTDIENYLRINGQMLTRQLISFMSIRHGVTKQCISGNISFMTKRQGITHIISNKSNSVIYV